MQLGLIAVTQRYVPDQEMITLAAERDAYRKLYYELLERMTGGNGT